MATMKTDAMKRVLNSIYDTDITVTPITMTFTTGDKHDILKNMTCVYSKNTLKIKKVIFNAPATIVYWTDGTKTIVKAGEHDAFDPEKGLAMAIAKKFFGNKGNYYNHFAEWLPADYVPTKE